MCKTYNTARHYDVHKYNIQDMGFKYKYSCSISISNCLQQTAEQVRSGEIAVLLNKNASNNTTHAENKGGSIHA